jgi:hypothetical protein
MGERLFILTSVMSHAKSDQTGREAQLLDRGVPFIPGIPHRDTRSRRGNPLPVPEPQASLHNV